MIRDALNAGLIAYSPDISEKKEVLRKISDMVSSSSDESAENVYDALTSRESLGSTGFGHGVAIPHCRLPGMDRFLVGILITGKGVDFDSVDGEDVRIFPFVIGPESEAKEYLKLLSSIAQILRNSSLKKEILSTHSPEKIYELIKNQTLPEKDAPIKRPGRKMLHVFIQNEDYFDEMLQVFAGTESTSAMVIEGHESTDYLMKSPLFAGFWNTDFQHFNRIIVAVVRDELVNSTIRSIEYICGKLSDIDDIMVTVTDLQSVYGSLGS